jgi:hypothetical protein
VGYSIREAIRAADIGTFPPGRFSIRTVSENYRSAILSAMYPSKLLRRRHHGLHPTDEQTNRLKQTNEQQLCRNIRPRSLHTTTQSTPSCGPGTAIASSDICPNQLMYLCPFDHCICWKLIVVFVFNQLMYLCPSYHCICGNGPRSFWPPRCFYGAQLLG